ncbi:MAG: formate dehydrogenase accessory sulfurtransferase FdhD [Chthoniobacterales bacterium]
MNQDGIESGKVIRHRGDGELEYQPDDLTIEEPLEIRISGRTVATTMRTPGHDEELAVGFLLSEGVIRSRSDIVKLSRPDAPRNRDNIVDIELAEHVRLAQTAPQRLGTITSSCGLCGRDSIEAMRQRFQPARSAANLRLTVELLLGLPDKMREHQQDFGRTGGIHAAAIFARNGTAAVVREDIGRHNAVDKAIGRAVLDGSATLNEHILLVSGRASFEIVQKALAAGIPIIASVSAPSALAVSFCRENNQTLIGFLRPPSFNLYSHAERIILETAKS